MVKQCGMHCVCVQLTTEVMQLFSDDDEVEKAFSGENVKIKLKNVEEEVCNGQC